MSSVSTTQTGYSTQVRIWLNVGNREIRIGKTGPKRIYLDQPEILPPGDAELVIAVDASEERYEIQLLPERDADPRVVYYAPRTN